MLLKQFHKQNGRNANKSFYKASSTLISKLHKTPTKTKKTIEQFFWWIYVQQILTKYFQSEVKSAEGESNTTGNFGLIKEMKG